MKKRLTILLVLLFSISFLFGADGNMVVYRTNTGSKYHLSGCRYLSKSKISITLERAVSSGLTPCSVCNPPKLDARNQDLYRVDIEGNKNSKNVDSAKMLQARVIRIVEGDTLVV